MYQFNCVFSTIKGVKNYGVLEKIFMYVMNKETGFSLLFTFVSFIQMQLSDDAV